MRKNLFYDKCLHFPLDTCYFVAYSSMKFGKLTALALAGTLTFAACKYDEGPKMSLRTKRDRVSNEWIVEKFTLDGKDMTKVINKDSSVHISTPQQEDTMITYNFTTILSFFRTGSYGVDVVRVEKDANNNPKYTTNNAAYKAENVYQGFNAMPGCSAIYNAYLDSMPSPFKYIKPHGKWAFDKGHYKIMVKPDLSFINDETGNAKNTLDWTIIRLNEKKMILEGLDENFKPWRMELKAINKEDYFL